MNKFSDYFSRNTESAHGFRNVPRSISAKAAYIALLLLLFSITLAISVSFSQQSAKSNTGTTRNQNTITALDRELAVHGRDSRYCSVLRGLRWCVSFCENDANLNFTFTNYVTMLDELAINHSHPTLEYIVHNLIVKEFERAIPRFYKIFAADLDGYEDFISILPIAYRHHIPVEPLKKFAISHFPKMTSPNRLKEFRQAVDDLNYDLLTDLIVDAAFVDEAYTMGASKDFQLPQNDYQTFMAECAKIPFVRKYGDDTYDDQNYYATHVLLALNHYGQHPIKASAVTNHVYNYLNSQYITVRSKVGDLDLLCEYLYCFRNFRRTGMQLISEGEQHIMSRQNHNGSWGTTEDFAGDPYDQLHPTWTAITLLVLTE